MSDIRNVYLRLHGPYHREVKVLAARTDRHIDDLYNEALELLLARHGVDLSSVERPDTSSRTTTRLGRRSLIDREETEARGHRGGV
jgi:N-formylglutamate amidohydrolase